MQGRRTRLRIILNKSSGPIPQTKSRALADASGKKIPGLVAGRRDYFGKRGSGLCIWQQPRQPLTRDDAAVKVAGRPAFCFSANLDDIAPNRCEIVHRFQFACESSVPRNKPHGHPD